MENSPFFDSIDCNAILDVFNQFVVGVEIKSLLCSAGGVRLGKKHGQFVIVLNDYHENLQSMLETFVHEILHIILFISCPLADHEKAHPKIREVSAQLAAEHRQQLLDMLSRFVTAEELKRISAWHST